MPFLPLRPLKRGFAGLKIRIVLVVLGLAVATHLVAADSSHELVRDPHFECGFYLIAPPQGKRVQYGTVAGLAHAKPVWDLDQWSSKFPLQPADCVLTNETLWCSNSAKSVRVVEPGSPAADLSLAVNAATEYGNVARKSQAEPWVHLLVEQYFQNPPSLTEVSALNFYLEARLKDSELANTNGYSPTLHAAQFQIFLTVCNRNPKSPGHGECYWFGIPVYDDRERMPGDFEAQDFGQTRLFIYTPASTNFTQMSAHHREWITLQADLLPLMRKGLEHAWAKGFIKGSRDFADYHPYGIFMGWEVPGVFDVEMQVRNLSLKAIPSRP